MDLKDSVFWYMNISQKTVEAIRQIEQENGQGCTLGALKIASAKVEVLQAVLDEAELKDEYQRWCEERGSRI